MAEEFGTTRANLSNHLACLREQAKRQSSPEDERQYEASWIERRRKPG